MQEIYNNYFGLKKCNTTLHQAKIGNCCYFVAVVLSYFCLLKGIVVLFWPETFFMNFLHLMVLYCKVFPNHFTDYDRFCHGQNKTSEILKCQNIVLRVDLMKNRQIKKLQYLYYKFNKIHYYSSKVSFFILNANYCPQFKNDWSCCLKISWTVSFTSLSEWKYFHCKTLFF